MLKIHSFLQEMKDIVKYFCKMIQKKQAKYAAIIVYVLVGCILVLNFSGFLNFNKGNKGLFVRAEVLEENPSEKGSEVESNSEVYAVIRKDSYTQNSNLIAKEETSDNVTTYGAMEEELSLFATAKSDPLDITTLSKVPTAEQAETVAPYGKDTESNSNDSNSNNSNHTIQSDVNQNITSESSSTKSSAKSSTSVSDEDVTKSEVSNAEKNDTIVTDSNKKNDTSTVTAKAKADAKAKVEAKPKAEAKVEAKPKEEAVEAIHVVDELVMSTNNSMKLKLAKEDLEVLERIVEAEATGEDIYGKILVANVVLNRVISEEFPDTVKEVVFQKIGSAYQFSPTKDGRYWSVTVSKSTKKAVKKALNGEDYSKGALYFFARKLTTSKKASWFDTSLQRVVKYGCHEFYGER